MKEGKWIYWKIGLPEESEAMADLDDLCKRTGLQRAEVSRLILLTWSAARRGKVNEMWGFSPGIMLTSPSIPVADGTSTHKEEPAPLGAPGTRRVVKPSAGAAAKAITLDD